MFVDSSPHVAHLVESICRHVERQEANVVDTVHFRVTVYDFDQSDAIVRRLDLPVDAQFGNLLVRVFDLEGGPAAVRIAVGGVDTTAGPVSEHLFTELLWGNQTVFTAESENYYGAVDRNE